MSRLWSRPCAWLSAVWRGALLGVQVLFMSLMYVPFVWAVLVKSVVQKSAQHPEDPMPPGYLLSCTVLFLALCALPFVFAHTIFPALPSDVHVQRDVVLGASVGFLGIAFVWQSLACWYLVLRSGRRWPKMRHWKMARRGSAGLINATKVISFIFEFLQLLVLALHDPNRRTWSPWVEDKLDVFSLLVARTPPWAGQELLVVSAVEVALVGLYSILIGVFIVRNIKAEVTGASILYEFWSGTLFVPIVQRLVQVLFCRISDHQLVWAGGWSDQVQECFEGAHKNAAAGAMLMLLFYMSSATFMATYQTAITPVTTTIIQFSPAFRTFERTLKSVLVVGLVFSRHQPDARAGIMLGASVTLLVVGYLAWPCSSKSLNRAMLGLNLAIVWAAILKTGLLGLGRTAALVALGSGWGLILVPLLMFTPKGVAPTLEATQSVFGSFNTSGHSRSSHQANQSAAKARAKPHAILVSLRSGASHLQGVKEGDEGEDEDEQPEDTQVDGSNRGEKEPESEERKAREEGEVEEEEMEEEV